MGGAQPLAITMAKGTALIADVALNRLERRKHDHYLDHVFTSLDDAIDASVDAAKSRRAESFGVRANAVDLLERMIERGITPDALTDQTSAHDPLTAVKSASKLLHVLARAEAEDLGADEALLLNSAGDVAEATSGNVFWLADGRLFTPPLTDGALAGVTRGWVLRLAAELGLSSADQSGTPDDLRAAEGVFLTLSSLEIVPVSHLDGAALRSSPVIRRLHEAYQASVRRAA
jgi:branched-subunit amino acid aminotransferase/4-amino-4-deoxychorismate lyase